MYVPIQPYLFYREFMNRFPFVGRICIGNTPIAEAVVKRCSTNVYYCITLYALHSGYLNEMPEPSWIIHGCSVRRNGHLLILVFFFSTCTANPLCLGGQPETESCCQDESLTSRDKFPKTMEIFPIV